MKLLSMKHAFIYLLTLKERAKNFLVALISDMTERSRLVQTLNEFGHMGTIYDQDPKMFLELKFCFSYASCDKMTKKSPCIVGLD